MVVAQRDAARRFFALPPERKLELLASADPCNRGYTPPGEQRLGDAGNQPDTKEGLYIGREVAAAPPGAPPLPPLHGPNRWPPEEWVPGFRQAMQEYHEAMLGLADRLLRLLAAALGLQDDYFADKFDDSIATLRPLHYSGCARARQRAGVFGWSARRNAGGGQARAPSPCCRRTRSPTDCNHAPAWCRSAHEGDPEQGELGAGAHTDFGCITLLLTDAEAGLQARGAATRVLRQGPGLQGVGASHAQAARAAQVFHAGRWVDVPPRPDCFVVNVGDLLERWGGKRAADHLHARARAPGLRHLMRAIPTVNPGYCCRCSLLLAPGGPTSCLFRRCTAWCTRGVSATLLPSSWVSVGVGRCCCCCCS